MLFEALSDIENTCDLRHFSLQSASKCVMISVTLRDKVTEIAKQEARSENIEGMKSLHFYTEMASLSH